MREIVYLALAVAVPLACCVLVAWLCPDDIDEGDG